MGIMQHDVIVATTWDEVRFDNAKNHLTSLVEKYHINRAKRHKEFTEFVSPINGYQTLLIGPDGSKLGWDMSDVWDKIREEMITYLKNEGGYWDFVAVSYGELGVSVKDSSWYIPDKSE